LNNGEERFLPATHSVSGKLFESGHSRSETQYVVPPKALRKIVISAWVGASFLENTAEPYGDDRRNLDSSCRAVTD